MSDQSPKQQVVPTASSTAGLSVDLRVGWSRGETVAHPGRSAVTAAPLTMMRTVCLPLSIAVIALAGCIGPSEGPHHVFPLKEAPAMLTEELAVAKATETFTKEGYKMEQWRMYRPDSPSSKARDGTPDNYFYRFSFRPTEGRVHFTDGKRYRIVQVRLEGDRLVCFMFYGL